MLSLRDRSQLYFPIALVVTAAVAMLPAGWRLGWTRDAAEIVRFPMRPFTHAGNKLAAWLRPPPAMVEGVSSEDIEQLTRDRDEAMRLYYAENLKVDQLREQIAQLQGIPAKTRSLASRLVIAYVTVRSPGSALGPVELTLEAGAPQTVPSGSIAVYASVYMLGRTAGLAERGRCALVPITNKDSGPLRTAVFPRGKPDPGADDATSLHLAPTGRGGFVGEVPRDRPIAEGDLVRLVDEAWPGTAQMMIVGTVSSVRVDDSEPLRNRVTVDPSYVVRDVSEVTLVIEEERDVDPRGGAGRVMRWAFFALAAFTFLILEMSLSNVFVVRSLGNIAPSFVAVLAVFVSLFAPRATVLWACWTLGLLFDLSIYMPQGTDLPGPVLGPYALGYSGACLLLLYVRSMLFRSRVLTIAVMTILFVAVANLIAIGVYAIQGLYPGGEITRRLGIALYSGVLALLLARPLVWTTPMWSFRSASQRHAGWR